MIAVLAGSNRVQAEEPVPATAPIAYKYLSNEDVDPYLHGGKPPRHPDYILAVKKIRNVKSCLVKEEQKKQHPDLDLFNWNYPRNSAEVSVCLFRVFSSIGDMEGAADWLKHQGFEVSFNNKYRKYNYIKKDLLLTRLMSSYDSKKLGPRRPESFLYRWTFGWFVSVYSESVSVYWTQTNKVMSCNYSANRI